MKKIHLLIIYVASIVIFATGCNRLDVAGMVINRSDTEERVADWLDYNAQNGEPVIENAPDEYHVYSCSDLPSAMTRRPFSPFMPAIWSTRVGKRASG